MINLICAPNLKKHIPTERIIYKIQNALTSESVQYHLKNMNFDHRYTKPINLCGLDIIYILNNANFDILLGTYSQNFLKWKLFPVNSYKPSDKKNILYFNTRQLLRRTPWEWEETLWHELVHIADHLSEFRFDHGDNDLSGDDESAPVKFAKFMAALPMKDFN